MDAGLTIRKSTYFNSFLFPPIAAARLLGLAVDGEAVPSAPLNGVLQAIFATERLLLRRGSLPFGVSILVIAEQEKSIRKDPLGSGSKLLQTVFGAVGK